MEKNGGSIPECEAAGALGTLQNSAVKNLGFKKTCFIIIVAC